MKKQFAVLFSLSVLSMVLFMGIFKLLQNDKVYHNTIGLVSQNYKRHSGWHEFKMSKVSEPYRSIENEDFLQWDASIYNCIKENDYKQQQSCYGKVRAAFFPLFPYLWRIIGVSPKGMSLLNYLMFLLALSFLVVNLLPDDLYLRATTFVLLITLPTNVIYMIPYTESLFILCMTIVVMGLLKDRYSLFFIGVVLLAMVRPATLFVLLAMIAAECFFFLKSKDLKGAIKSISLKSLPFVVGYFIALFSQYSSSGSWTAFVDAQRHWSGGLQKLTQVSDWSIEGFGMNTFSIFFVAIPAAIFLIYLSLRVMSKKPSILKLGEYKVTNYLLLVSLSYLAGIFLFSLLTSGGNFHSFFRFIMCSPLFFIAILILISKISVIDTKLVSSIFGASCLLLFLYLSTVDFGGSRFQFSYFGLLLLIFVFAYILYRKYLSAKLDVLALTLVVILNTIWNTYMLNMFLSNGWIFT